MGILQPVSGADDRLGSFASFPRCPSYVRLCSKTGDKADIARGRICAKFGSRRSHSITSSARPSNVGGTVRPRAFAVLRLITSSNFSGASTGSSLGFAPLKMRSA